MGSGFSRSAGDVQVEFDQPAGEETGERSLRESAAQAADGAKLPYPPSWIDRLTGWIGRLPVPPWAFYLALGLALSLAYMALLLSSNELATGMLSLDTALVYSFLNGMTYAYLLGLIHYLDNSAAAALARFRPVLTVDETGYNSLMYRITTLAARPTLIASGLGVIYTLLTLVITVVSVGIQSADALSPVVIVMIWASNLGLYVLVAVMVYHTLHQLRMVNEIYTRHTRINIFQLGPLYSLSGLTARTAVGIGIPTYLWFQVNSSSDMGTSLPDIIQTVFLSIMVIVTFVWPLVGAHILLEREKQQLQDQVARRIEATISVLHNSVDTAAMENRGALHETLDALVTEQGVVDKLRTWPWRTGTLSGLGVAFLVPILIWLVQRLLERLGI